MKQTQQEAIRIGFRKMFYQRPPDEIKTIRKQILEEMEWTDEQLKNRLIGRTYIHEFEIIQIAKKCNINIADYWPEVDAFVNLLKH